MTYSAPFPLVQFQFQSFPRSPPPTAARPHDECGTDRWRVQPSPFRTAHSGSALFAAQFREMCNLKVVATEGRAMRARATGNGGPVRRGLRVEGSGWSRGTTARALVVAWEVCRLPISRPRGGHRERLRQRNVVDGCDRRPSRPHPPLACASFRHALWAALAVTRTSLGVPQDCWFDAALSGAQVFKARAPGFSSLSYARARVPALLGGAGFIPSNLVRLAQRVSLQAQEFSA